MFDQRINNIQIFRDTINIIDGSQKLQEAIRDSLSKQKLYHEYDEVDVQKTCDKECLTVVSTKRSFEAASSYSREGKKVCVLNFASSTSPGGGVARGSSAQEESLCRCSTLYHCLAVDEMQQGFYNPHIREYNPMNNDDCIYTPQVYVIRNDNASMERMAEADWYCVDVLTCAAPNLIDIDDMPTDMEVDLYKLYVQRIDRIFRVAAVNGAEVLILGAFGCGAFGNSPEAVSKAFYEVQKKYESNFDIIEYAIFCGGNETGNYDAFCKAFGSKKVYDLRRFHEAHDRDYRRALSEVKAGCKRSHWMWYIFPQIAGLGFSKSALYYSISDIEEAKAYIQDSVLGAHMTEICEALLSLDTDIVTDILEWPDDLKLKSSMTLFEAASDESLFGKVLDKYYGGERDSATLNLIHLTKE